MLRSDVPDPEPRAYANSNSALVLVGHPTSMPVASAVKAAAIVRDRIATRMAEPCTSAPEDCPTYVETKLALTEADAGGFDLRGTLWVYFGGTGLQPLARPVACRNCSGTELVEVMAARLDKTIGEWQRGVRMPADDPEPRVVAPSDSEPTPPRRRADRYVPGTMGAVGLGLLGGAIVLGGFAGGLIRFRRDVEAGSIVLSTLAGATLVAGLTLVSVDVHRHRKRTRPQGATSPRVGPMLGGVLGLAISGRF